MAKKIGIIFIVIGTVLIIAAISLFAYNRNQSDKAEKYSVSVLAKLKTQINNSGSDFSDGTSAIEIDGDQYIGYISLPTLKLELPVMSDWDYERLNIAPCRYYGSLETNDLVIAGHNYSGHFENIQNLNIGDSVVFTDVYGVSYAFSVGDIEVLAPDQTLEMIQSDWDLTLYTCNYIGDKRITVRCEKLI